MRGLPLLAILLLLHFNAMPQQISDAKRLLNFTAQLKEISRQRNLRAQNFTIQKLKTAQSYSKELLLVDITNSGLPVYRAALNAGAAITTGVTLLQNQSLGVNLEGENMNVGVWDDGIVKDHIELGNRVLSKEGPAVQIHCTHVTGTIIATGINPAAKGMAPKATASTWFFDNDDAEMASLATADQTGLLFSNHSYGTVTGWYRSNGVWVWSGDPAISTSEDYRFGFYDEKAVTLDKLTYYAPYYTIVWAAGNDRTEIGDGTHPRDGNGGTGYDCIIPDAVAKNIITVGAVNKVLSYTDQSSVVMSPFSSWGPTDDGRIKPDLTAAGVLLFSLNGVGVNQYYTSSGTSMATPNVTGSLMLVQELYSKLHGGNFMRAATLKGLAIHTTKEAGTYPGPDYSYGWGLLDVSAAAKVLLQEDGHSVMVKEINLANNQTYSLNINPQLNQKITVTICWTDPAGTPVQAALDPVNAMLVNDLDVRITDDVGTIKMPWILDPSNPFSNATNGDNYRDNVEKIEFDNPQAKKYTITVSHKGKLVNGSQNFSLIVTSKPNVVSGNTFYWIGNSGNWNDGLHWSLTTGGTATNNIPTQNDKVIFDENSFDGITNCSVNLTANSSCKKFTWLTDRPAGLSLNMNTLQVNADFTLASKTFKVLTAGTLQFESTDAHSINVHTGSLVNASLEFAAGSWTMGGKFDVTKIDIKGGSVYANNLAFSVKELNAAANTTLNITGSTLDSLNKSTLNEGTILMSDSATIRLSTNAIFNWNNIHYKGNIIVDNRSTFQITGSNDVSFLSISNGGIINLADGSKQNLNTISLTGTQGNPVSVIASAKASLNILNHNKLCFDYLNITNVDVSGNSVVNAGLNSTITNSLNWLATDCSTILYADFTEHFACVNSLARFDDGSTGDASTWSWNFGDNKSAANTSSSQNAEHRYASPGKYIVTLTISKGSLTQSYAKQIEVVANDLQENSIVLNGSTLLSFRQSNSYQWYKNDLPIKDEIMRGYNYDGNPGIYTVVVSDAKQVCNYAAAPFVVTVIDEVKNSVEIYPNPVNDFIILKVPVTSLPLTFVLYDVVGRVVLTNSITEPDYKIDVTGFTGGIYILELKSPALTRTKLIINR